MKKILALIFYILSFLLFLTTCAVWIAIPEEVVLNSILTIIMTVMIISAILLDLKNWKSIYRSKQFAKLASNVFSALLVFAILGLVNYLAYKRPLHWDFSQNAKNSLSAQSIKVLKNLDHELEVIVFARKADFPAIMKLLDLYRFYKNDIDFKTIDVELNPAEVSAFGITTAPTLVFNYDEKRDYVSDLNELNITNALIKVSRENDPIVCYAIGHGEGDLDDKEAEGLSFLQSRILASNVVIKTHSLLEKGTIEKDCNLYLIWGPKEDFTPEQVKALDDYLTGGGHLMVGLDPDVNRDSTPALRSFVGQWGITIMNGLSVDLLSNAHGSNGVAPIVKTFKNSHSISKEFALPVFFPLVGAVMPTEEVNREGTYTPLATSNISPAAWLDLKPAEIAEGKLTYDQEVDIAGPIAYASIWEGSAMVIAFANTGFVRNSYERFTGNFNFFLNSLLYGVDEGRLISFDLPSLPDDPIFISGPQKGIIFYFSVILVPLAFFSLSLLVYWRRKKL